MSTPLTLNPGQTATLTVGFDPAVVGAATGTVTIASNASSAATIALSGTGQPGVNGFSCTSTSITGANSDWCTVTFTAQTTGPLTVIMASNNSAVTVPASVSPPTGSWSAGFAAVASAVNTAQTATLTATVGTSSKSVVLQLNSSTAGLSLSTTSVAFGTELLNTATSQSVTVTLSGSVAATISGVTVSGAGFSASGLSTPLTLNPGQTATLTVGFDPTTAGAATGTVTITSNAVTATIALSGTGQPAVSAVSCSNASLTGAATDPCTVTLTGAAASATVVSLTSSNSAVTVPASVTVAAGASSATFTATATAVSTAQTATLTAAEGGTSQTYALQLNASVPGLSVSPSSVAFGTDLLNTSTSQSVTVTSSGTAALTISGVSVSGAGFSVSGITVPLTLNPGQTATLTVGFDPTVAGAASGAVTISSNASSGGTIALSGTGQPAVSAVSCSNASLTGAATDPCTVTLTSATASATAVSLTSSNSAVTVPASVTVAAGTSSAAFTATATAVTTAQSVTLTAAEGGSSQTYALQLNAFVPGLTLSATTLTFGTDVLNTATTQSLTVTSSGTAQLILSGATVTGAGFSVSGINAPITLNPGQTATLTIGFDPAVAGVVTGIVTINSNALTPATIILSGTGQPGLSALSCVNASVTETSTDACTVTMTGAAATPLTVSLASSNSAVTVPASVTIAAGTAGAAFTATAAAVSSAQTASLTATLSGTSASYQIQLNAAIQTLAVSSTVLSFGSVTENTTLTEPVTLTSSGTAPLIINAASVIGTGFSLAGVSFPLTLNPSQSATLNVQFDPTALGNMTGIVSLTSNATSGATTSILLSGTGSCAELPGRPVLESADRVDRSGGGL